MESHRPHISTSSPLHILHLSYNLARPKYTDPEKWLSRVAFVSGVAEKLLPFGKQTVIYNIHHKGEIERNGVRYIFPGFNRWQLRLPFAYNRFIKSLKPDVVLVHGLIFPWQVIMLRLIIGPNVKIICQHHADRPYKDFRKYIFRWAEKYVSAYLFASKEHGEEWVKAQQISSMNKIHEIMGMSSIFYPENEKNKNRRGKVYLWIGDLDENKDPLIAVNAFNEFSKRHPEVELHMIFQEAKLDVRSHITSNIHLVGKVEHSQLQDWFNLADFIISTSRYESAGIAVCEAMSCGCFPILTNIASFRMMTGNGKVGKLYEGNGLLEALEETFNNSPSKEIIDHFNAELSFEANARKIINLIRQL